MHSTGKIHRDIKPANILLTDKGEVKIADFGVSAELSKTETNWESFVGTHNWMAPEMLSSKKYNYKVDIWAFGITGINIATGKVPYQDIKPFLAMKAIWEGESPKLEGEFSSNFHDFIDQCLIWDPALWPTATQLLKHPFVNHTKWVSMLLDLLTCVPQWEISQEEIKSESSSSGQKVMIKWQPDVI